MQTTLFFPPFLIFSVYLLSMATRAPSKCIFCLLGALLLILSTATCTADESRHVRWQQYPLPQDQHLPPPRLKLCKPSTRKQSNSKLEATPLRSEFFYWAVFLFFSDTILYNRDCCCRSDKVIQDLFTPCMHKLANAVHCAVFPVDRFDHDMTVVDG